MVAEQRRVGDAAGVHGGERDSGLFVPPVGHLLDGEDVAQLGILVRLGSDEAIAVDHGVLIAVAVEPRGEAGHGAEVGARGHLAGEGVGVGGDRADDAEALVDAHVLGADEVFKHEVSEEEVAEVGDADGLLEAVLGEGGGDRVGVVDGGVAHERLELLGVLLAAELLDEGADVGEVAELELHDLVLVGGEPERLGLLLALGDVAAGHDDEVVAALDESLGGVEAEAGGCAGHDGGLLGARGGHGERSLRLGLWFVTRMRWSVCVVVVGARVGFRRMMRGRDPFRSAELIGYDVSRYRYGGWGSGDAWGSRRTSPRARGSARDAMRRGRWRQNHARSPLRRGRHERSGTRAGRRRVEKGMEIRAGG